MAVPVYVRVCGVIQREWGGRGVKEGVGGKRSDWRGREGNVPHAEWHA